ncbi:MAG: hypothetical protein PHZ26_02510 [Candidatus Gracilibacteria bacterium]|nr:hypothetical protein [Candidatus Gracilibacteria bacterium]MDD2908605.1 hypothetical protein [Candidatus Gracilibacteria bacterium]
MDLLIASNYNVTDEKWSIVIKYGDNIKAVTLERIARIKYFPNSDFFGRKNYYKIFILGLKKLIKLVDIEKINKNTKEIIIKNVNINKQSISKLLLTYYNDFIN